MHYCVRGTVARAQTGVWLQNWPRTLYINCAGTGEPVSEISLSFDLLNLLVFAGLLLFNSFGHVDGNLSDTGGPYASS